MKKEAEPKKKRNRIVMKEADRQTIRKNLLFSFMHCGASEELAMDVITHGSLPMETWIQRYICHETDYVEKGLTEDNYRAGCFAWMAYKAMQEVVHGLKVTEETRELAAKVAKRKEEKR